MIFFPCDKNIVINYANMTGRDELPIEANGAANKIVNHYHVWRTEKFFFILRSKN